MTIHKAATSIGLAKRVAIQMEDAGQALAFLRLLLERLWPEVAKRTNRVLWSNWQGPQPVDLLRLVAVGLSDRMDILDFSEALLRGLNLNTQADKVSRIMQGEIEASEIARNAADLNWGPTLKEAAGSTDASFIVYEIRKRHNERTQKSEVLLQQEFEKLLGLFDRDLKKEGLTVDRRKSYIEVSSHGSDGMRAEGQVQFSGRPSEAFSDKWGLYLHGSDTWQFEA